MRVKPRVGLRVFDELVNNSDLGLLKALQIKRSAQFREVSERWRPWSANAAIHFWRSMTSGGRNDDNCQTLPGGQSMAACLAEESRAAVNVPVDKTIHAGGTADPTPTQDYGFMYSRSYEDLDGHIREVM